MSGTFANSDFCEELRKAREFRGLSLEDIARSTRIPLDYLRAIDQGQLDSVPEAIRKGVITSYAKAAGMNADLVERSLKDPSAKSAKSGSGRVAGVPYREKMTVGMTRAQIQTVWFAKLSSNAGLHWGVTAVLLGILVVLGLTSTPHSKTSVYPYSNKLPYGGILRQVPFVKVSEPGVSDSDPFLIDFVQHVTTAIALDTGFVETELGINEWETHNLYPFDTIEVTHGTGLRFSFPPGFPLLVLTESAETLRTHFTHDSTAAWICSPDLSLEADAEGDSAVADTGS
ncbi:MAG: helix-turn-helix domain-containing protein [Calditrichaeota bacterium]|nr:helix-turn-helix domain-containing protein [Calditrichota bacterium]MCB9391287.1 helix-turn-helix domain-containing protein [Calditrichota bacterium]